MEKFVQLNNKKIIIGIVIILMMPIILTCFSYIIDFVLELGRITGTVIRYIGNGNICKL